jgi:hypothetical protein
MWTNWRINYWFTRKLSGRAVEFVTMRKGEMLSMEGKGRAYDKIQYSISYYWLRNQLLLQLVRLLCHTVL